jgi:hypothetical protein
MTTDASPDLSFSLFHNEGYIAHNNARLDHLASLGLPLDSCSVLEPGAGIGDHTLFYLRRSCDVTAMEPRAENCAAFRVHMNEAAADLPGRWTLVQGDVYAVQHDERLYDIVHCYGLLYHLNRPASAIATLAQRCGGLFLLESCVSFGEGAHINLVAEPGQNPSQAFDGVGCRPTRGFVFEELRKHFAFVYTTRTQPSHPEFPLDWTAPKKHMAMLARAIFVASHVPLNQPNLVGYLPELQIAG